MLEKGSQPVPGYTLVKPLGRGGFGEVWKATAPGGVPAALKFINLVNTPGLKELRAIRRIKEVRHINLLTLNAIWLLDDQHQLIDDETINSLERLAKNLSIKDAVAKGLIAHSPDLLVIAMSLGDQNLMEVLEDCQKRGLKGIGLGELLRYTEDVARGLDFLNEPRHDLGRGQTSIQHCDIKPQNIVLVGNGAVVCDFGLVRVLGESFVTSGVTGTPDYMAPEIIAEQGPHAKTDQYSLALTYYRLRTGMRPMSATTINGVFQAHREGDLDLSGVSDKELGVLQKATSVEPTSRYSSSLEFVRELRARLADEPAQSGEVLGQGQDHDSEADALPDSPLPIASVGGQKSAADPNVLVLRVVEEEKGSFSFSVMNTGRDELLAEGSTTVGRGARTNIESELRELFNLQVKSTPGSVARLGKLLYRHILPKQIQEVLSTYIGSLVLETDTSPLPLELLHDRDEYLSQNIAMTSKPTSIAWPPLPDPVERPLSSMRALIIADPFSNLPGAASEARELRDVFEKHQIQCDVFNGQAECNYGSVWDAIDEGDYDIVHYAGGLRYLPDDSTSGIRMAEDRLFMPDDVRDTLHGSPFVFLNVCTDLSASGTSWEDRSRGVQEFVKAFVTGNADGRARAVIASVWWPKNDVSLGFCGKYYETLFAGESFGEAIRIARRIAKDRCSDPLQWACYSAFGDPHARLGVAEQAPEDTSHEDLSPTVTQFETELPEGTDQNLTPKLSDEATKVLAGAMATARITNWEFVTTMHIWIGLTYVKDGVMCRALRELNIDPDVARRSLRATITCADSASPAEIGWSENAEELIRSALHFANSNASGEVRESHLTMALLSKNDSSSAAILEITLKQVNADLQTLKTKVIELLSTDTTYQLNSDSKEPDVWTDERLHSASKGVQKELFAEDGTLRLEHFESDCRNALEAAADSANITQQEQIRSPNLFLGFIDRAGSVVAARLSKLGVDPERLETHCGPRRARSSRDAGLSTKVLRGRDEG